MTTAGVLDTDNALHPITTSLTIGIALYANAYVPLSWIVNQYPLPIVSKLPLTFLTMTIIYGESVVTCLVLSCKSTNNKVVSKVYVIVNGTIGLHNDKSMTIGNVAPPLNIVYSEYTDVNEHF